MERLQVVLDNQDKYKLMKLADKEGRTISNLIRNIILEKLKSIGD